MAFPCEFGFCKGGPLFAWGFLGYVYASHAYDALNRLSQKSYPDSSAVNYTYDNDSRLTQVTDPTGTYQFTFDNMGRLKNDHDQLQLPHVAKFHDGIYIR